MTRKRPYFTIYLPDAYHEPLTELAEALKRNGSSVSKEVRPVLDSLLKKYGIAKKTS